MPSIRIIYPHITSAIKSPLYCSRTERGKETPTSKQVLVRKRHVTLRSDDQVVKQLDVHQPAGLVDLLCEGDVRF